MKIIGMMMLLTASVTSFAKPVYLECFVLTHTKNKVEFTVMLDEASSSITHVSNGQQFKTEGFFSPKKINYKQTKAVAGMVMQNGFEINRTNLSIVQTLVVVPENSKEAAEIGSASEVQKGSCVIADTSDQKV